MRKKRIVKIIVALAMVIIMLVLFFPVVYRYKDGGTVEIRAIAYRYIHWHFLDSEVYDKYKQDPRYASYYHDESSDTDADTTGYWERTDFSFFPNNYSKSSFFEEN